MTRPNYLFIPDWGRYVPGFLFCLVFAFFGMNLDRLIGNYHKADVASSGIPVLEQTLQEKMEVGDDDESLAAMRKAIEKHRSALDKVDGTLGQQQSRCRRNITGCVWRKDWKPGSRSGMESQ